MLFTKNLFNGYENFQKKYSSANNPLMKYLHDNGQKPEIMFLSCCDSRVDPSLILDCAPGEIFVCRTVANILPPYEKAQEHSGVTSSLEFAINFLKVKYLIIMGHSDCGGVKAMIQSKFGEKEPRYETIDKWVAIAEEGIPQSRNVDQCARSSILNSRKNALLYPWISEKVKKKELEIHCWFFNIRNSIIEEYDDSKGWREIGKELK